MAIILNNLSDERLAELSQAVYSEQKRRFLAKVATLTLEVRDNPSLPRPERIRFLRDNNFGMSWSEALWFTEYNV